MSKDNHFGSLGTSELRPGVTPRRWEPEGGVNSLNKRIHKESKFADDNKNLPFSFKKPPKTGGRLVLVRCDNCGNVSNGTKTTVGIICNKCNKFSTVSEV